MGVGVGTGVGVGIGVGVGVGVGSGVGVGAGIGVGAEVGVGIGVGLGEVVSVGPNGRVYGKVGSCFGAGTAVGAVAKGDGTADAGIAVGSVRWQAVTRSARITRTDVHRNGFFQSFLMATFVGVDFGYAGSPMSSPRVVSRPFILEASPPG